MQRLPAPLHPAIRAQGQPLLKKPLLAIPGLAAASTCLDSLLRFY
jgi:hypothetical protein